MTRLPAVESLSPEEAAAEIEDLAQQIEAADEAYYNQDAPIFSDGEYDAKRRRLQALVDHFPGLSAPAAVVDSVGATPTGRFPKVAHAIPMLSLDNAFSDEDVIDFVRTCTAFSGALGSGRCGIDRRTQNRWPLRQPAI